MVKKNNHTNYSQFVVLNCFWKSYVLIKVITLFWRLILGKLPIRINMCNRRVISEAQGISYVIIFCFFYLITYLISNFANFINGKSYVTSICWFDLLGGCAIKLCFRCFFTFHCVSFRLRSYSALVQGKKTRIVLSWLCIELCLCL